MTGAKSCFRYWSTKTRISETRLADVPRRGTRTLPRNRIRPEAKPVVGLAARRTAVNILGRVVRQRRPLDQELDVAHGDSALQALAARDRALVRAILGAALRHRGQIASVLDTLIEKPIPERTGRVDDILHIGAAQILFLDVPDHAAVSLAVTIAELDRRARPYKALVNGVLRRLARERDDLLTQFSEPWRNTPVWLYARWQAAYGEDRAAAIAAAHLLEPNLDLTVKADASSWAERLGGRVVAADTVRLTNHSGRIEQLAGYETGAWWVQDAAASLPARLLGDVAGKRVADLCAAPGGKTAQLAAAGANVTAVDISAPRLKRLADNLRRLGLSADSIVSDLRTWQPDAPFDAILLDAPCSATGSIRRHPDVAWTKTEADIAALVAVQREILDRTIEWLSRGGVLVYCTCSLQPEEGERQVEAILARRSDLRRVPVTPDEIGGLAEAVTPDGDLRTLPSMLSAEPPQAGGLDGFFAARMRRV